MGTIDDRIKFSIGSWQLSKDLGEFDYPRGLAFDVRQGLLFVADYCNHRVQVFSSNDGSFVRSFGVLGAQQGCVRNPWGVAIDHEHERVLVSDSTNNRLTWWSLRTQSWLDVQEHSIELRMPLGVAIDEHYRRVLVVDSHNQRLAVLSAGDLSFLFSVGERVGQPFGDLASPSGLAIDYDRHRIIMVDTNNHRLLVLSLFEGSFLFEFGSRGTEPGEFLFPRSVCIDNQGRIIVVDTNNYRLQAFTHEGHHISVFPCNLEKPCGVAFDEHRGLIAFSAGHRVHVIGANQWLADTFTWRPNLHRYAPSWMKQAVLTMTMIRSLIDESSAMSMIPNELLFEIFSHL